MMRKKIENRLLVTCNDIDLTKLTNVEFYVRQPKFFGCYTPEVISQHEMYVVIPFEDAKKMRSGKVELQFAFTDAYGNPDASEVVEHEVNDFLREVGYRGNSG